MKTFDAAATRDALPFGRLIDAIARMFVQGCDVPLRHAHVLTTPDGCQGTVLIMPAWQADNYLGIKTVNIFPGNAARGLPGLFSTYTLYDARTGQPLALIDGNEITSRRTAAASALAASKLGRPDARRLLVVGAGRVAALLPLAYREVLPIKEGHSLGPRPGASCGAGRRLAKQRDGGNRRAGPGWCRRTGGRGELRHAGHGAGRARRLVAPGQPPRPSGRPSLR